MVYQGYSVRISPGQEKQDGYVEMQHGQQYTIYMHNYHDTRCDAEVVVDGKNIGTFRIDAQSSIHLERPEDDEGRFTFYKEGTSEARCAQIVSWKSDNGLVSVMFKPEKKQQQVKIVEHHHYYDRYLWPIYPPYYPPYFWSNTSTAGPLTFSHSTGKTLSSNFVGASMSDVPMASPGATGLSGHSDQSFYHVSGLDYDEGRVITINMRLVCVESVRYDEPRPLRGRATPVPPRIG